MNLSCLTLSPQSNQIIFSMIQDSFIFILTCLLFCFLSSPQATVLRTEAIFNQTSPVIGSFSSRGPNTIAVDILKVYIYETLLSMILFIPPLCKTMVDELQPDITAPGVDILAAYSPVGELSDQDTRHVDYTVLSGTSMSCPMLQVWLPMSNRFTLNGLLP